MRIVIVGAGVIGITSAWYLNKAGHDVVVLDRNAGPAQGASFANGGLLSVGHSVPSAAPQMIPAVLKSFFQKESPIKVRPDLSFYQTKWLLQNLAQCTTQRFKTNQQRMVHVAKLTRKLMHELQEEEDLKFENRQGGILQICRSDEQMAAAKNQQAMLNPLGLQADLLDTDGVVKIEPGLAQTKHNIVGGLCLVEEESGDCQLFTQHMEALLKKRGVEFHYNVEVESIKHNHGKVEAIETKAETFNADAYVIATGAYTHQLLKGIVSIPIYPVKGTSITVPVTQEEKAPQYAVFDTSSSVAMARFDNRVRVAGFARIAGFDERIDPREVESLKRSYQQWFPDSGDLENVSPWIGFRPMTPDGTPIIGKTPLSNLYINAGQGTYGFTMGCGSAKLLQQIIDSEVTDTDVADYSLNRY